MLVVFVRFWNPAEIFTSHKTLENRRWVLLEIDEPDLRSLSKRLGFTEPAATRNRRKL